MSSKGYEVFVVIRDKDYPFPQDHQGGLIEPWEAGWFPVATINGSEDSYELEALPFAEELAQRAADMRESDDWKDVYKFTNGGQTT